MNVVKAANFQLYNKYYGYKVKYCCVIYRNLLKEKILSHHHKEKHFFFFFLYLYETMDIK